MPRLLTLGLCLLLAPHAPQVLASQDEVHPFLETPLLLGAHRGGALLWPENTLLAFEEAAKRWPGILLEADLRLTSDGAVVVLHDATVDRTTNGHGAVAGMTLEALRALDAAYRFTPNLSDSFPHRGQGIQIPTLEEALQTAPEHRFLLEIKEGVEAVAPVLDVIRTAGAERRVILASFNPLVMHRVRELAPDLLTCFDFATGQELLIALRSGQWEAYTSPAVMLSVSDRLMTQFGITAEDVARLQSKGIVFQVHTLNSEQALREALALGVGSILTDNPKLLARLIRESSEDLEAHKP